MTIKQLLALLSHFPDDTVVYREDHEWGVCDVRGVRSVNPDKHPFTNQERPPGVMIK